MMLLIFFVSISKCFWSVCLLFIYFINEMMFYKKSNCCGDHVHSLYIVEYNLLIESKERRKLGKVKAEKDI